MPDSIRHPGPSHDKATFFASNTLTEHLLRGVAAFALLYTALNQQNAHPGWSLLAGALALVAMRGCPVCWAIDLMETLQQRFRATTGTRPPFH